MSNSIDIAALGIGVALGYGLRKELKSTGNVCKAALLSAVAGAATAAAIEDAKRKVDDPQSQAPEATQGQQGQQGSGQNSNGGHV